MNELIKALHNHYRNYCVTGNKKAGKIFADAAEAVEELQRILDEARTSDKVTIDGKEFIFIRKD